MILPRFAAFLVFTLCVATAQAASPHKARLGFAITHDVGFGNSVFVVGNHPDLGNWDVTRAIKLRYVANNVWDAEIGVQSGTQLQYKFIKRSTAAAAWCDSSNATDISGVLTRDVPEQPPAPYQGKTIYYLSGWNTTNIIFSSNGGSFSSAAMMKVGAGRTAGESLFKITGIGEAGASLQFVFTDNNGNYDKAPGNVDYFTELDVFHVQQGNVFSYQPPEEVSAPQIQTHFINSSAEGIANRNVRVYLPRGYTQNSTRRYPVVYLHDGQNVFDPGGAFGSWSADATATREIGQGRMREAILVGVDNTAARISEYMPPTDSRDGVPGRADRYAQFLIHNVRPFIDHHFRTLNDPKNTVTLGSSMGGLVSLYLGREHDTFGKIGVFSPAFWTSPNYVNAVAAGAKKPLRVYLDMGTNESEPTKPYWDDVQRMYDIHIAQWYAVNSELVFVAGCGQGHNEAAWRSRLPAAFRYLLPAREDPAELAQRESPPKLAVSTVDPVNRTAAFEYTSLYGFSYTLQRSSDLATWSFVSTSPPETLPTATRTIVDDAFGSGAAQFWKLEAHPAP